MNEPLNSENPDNERTQSGWIDQTVRDYLSGETEQLRKTRTILETWLTESFGVETYEVLTVETVDNWITFVRIRFDVYGRTVDRLLRVDNYGPWIETFRSLGKPRYVRTEGDNRISEREAAASVEPWYEQKTRTRKRKKLRRSTVYWRLKNRRDTMNAEASQTAQD